MRAGGATGGNPWRLRRLPVFEAAILGARHADALEYLSYYEKESEASVHFGKALIEDARWNDALGKLARHETTLMNSFTKTLQMLLVLQENRSNTKSEPVILEAVAHFRPQLEWRSSNSWLWLEAFCFGLKPAVSRPLKSDAGSPPPPE